MSTLIIKTPADLNKLAGWTIEDAGLGKGNNPSIRFKISHPAAETKVILIIQADIHFGRSGNVMVADAILGCQTFDLVEERNEQDQH